MKNNIIKMGIERELAERINSLMAIGNFEEDIEAFNELNFDMDSCIFRKRVAIDDKHLAELSVYTGQNNAWIECEVIYPNNVVLDMSEPVFDNIEGEYTLMVNENEEYKEYTLSVYVE